jgi:uncharacterized protein (DUF1697 family)
MTRHVAFVRAINVGGHAVVRMKDLQEMFASAGCSDVRTYIASGNIVFDAPAGSVAATIRKVGASLRKALGHEPEIVVRTAREIEAIVKAVPFKNVADEPDIKLYVAFLARAPKARPKWPLVSAADGVEAIQAGGRDVFILRRRMKNGLFGIPNSFPEATLGVPATIRNWATVTKVHAMAARKPE